MNTGVSPEPQSRPCPACRSAAARLRFAVGPFRVVQCLGCSLVYLQNPPPETTLYEEYHGTEEPDPRDYRADTPRPELRELYAINNRRVQVLKQLVPGGKLLDVGCGRGYFLKLAGEGGYDAEGIDVSETAAHYAREKMGVNARRLDAHELARSGARYDAITAWHVLEHFQDPGEILSTLRGLLAEGGLCFLEVPNLRSLKFMLARDKWQGGNHPRYHRTFFTGSTLGAMLRQSGFSSVARIRLSYRIPGRSRAYEQMKALLNLLSLDAFLDFAARK